MIEETSGGWLTKRHVYNVYVEILTPAQYQYMLAHPNQTYGPGLIAATAVCCSIAFCAVVLRIIARLHARAAIGKDDYTIVAALVLGLVYSALIASTVGIGFGQHIIYINPENTSAIGKNAWIALIILTAASYAVKLSILFLYRRLFPTPNFRIALWIVGGFCTAYFIAYFFSTTFECLPVGTQFSTKPHTCFDLDALFTAFSFINMFIDITLLLLPLPLIWRLHMSRRQKIQTSAIFSIGLLACVASLLRVVFSFATSNIDDAYYDAHTTIWATVEINMAITSACLPSLSPLVRYIFQGKPPSSSPSAKPASTGPDIPAQRTKNLGPSSTQTGKDSSTPNGISVLLSWLSTRRGRAWIL